MLAIFPSSHAEGREVGINMNLLTLAVGKGGHHLVTLILYVMTVEIVGELFLEHQRYDNIE